jgi:chromosome segregation protein
MKLKKLDITGFKSFHDRVCIPFPHGITAVVGPNGCGKSNVLDALRWAMGEQSVKQLRGKSMEDIIFAGTTAKAPLSMAEVSLLLQNDNGSAPEALRDFSEIMITRRLYRSGESGYFLNKQPCRLKDIHNVFLGSGMGARSYAFIQQGNIGAITDASPEERRAFIEEAAGVSRYKARKSDALRKLDQTQQNLLRLKDIMAEVSRQLAGVQRQAQKAQRHKKISAQIQDLDCRIARLSFDALSQRMAQTNVSVQQLTDQDVAQSTRLAALDADFAHIEIQQSEKHQQISEQKSRRFEIQRHVDRTENDLVHLRVETQRLTQELEALGKARIDIEAKNQTIFEEIAGVTHQHQVFSRKRDAVQAELAREDLALRGNQEALAAVNGQLEAAKTDLIRIVAEEARCNNIRQNAAANRETLQRRLKRLDENIAVAHRKVVKCQQAEKEATDHRDALQQASARLTQDIDTLQTRLKAKHQELSAHVTQAHAIALDAKVVGNQHQSLRKMADSHQWYQQGVRAILQAKAEGYPGSSREASGLSHRDLDPESILGTMADILEPEPGYETALDAALGEALQYVIVTDAQAGLSAIDYLSRHQAGRAGFIPLTASAGHVSEPAPGSSQRLLDHLKIPTPYVTLAEALIGHVHVTDALPAFDRQSETNTSIVTLQGDLLTHQGVFIGGSQDPGSGISARKQELRTLEARVKALALEMETARQVQQTLENEVQSIDNGLQRGIQDSHRVQAQQTDADKAVFQLTEQLKHARADLEITQLEQEQLLGEENDMDVEVAGFIQRLETLRAEVKAAQERVHTATESAAEQFRQMESIKGRIQDLKIEQTALTARVENSTQTLQRLEAFGADGTQRLGQVIQDIETRRRRLTRSEEKIGAAQHQLARDSDTLDQLSISLAASEADYQQIAAALGENDQERRRLKQDRETTREQLQRAQIEQSQIRLQLENISVRIQERYGKPLESIRFSADAAPQDVPSLEEAFSKLNQRLSELGDVNLGAIQEYQQLGDRNRFLETQHQDLVKAIEDLHKVIRKINRISQQRFMETFSKINEKLAEVFPLLFTGGHAELVLTEPDKPLETGVELMIHPHGKKLTRLSLLSGGEKALSAIAFIFSIFLIKPASFCLLDEIDAPLDDANVHRFNELLKMIGAQSQIIMVTHNKRSMEFADTLFGVTMEQRGVSKVVSVNLNRN